MLHSIASQYHISLQIYSTCIIFFISILDKNKYTERLICIHYHRHVWLLWLLLFLLASITLKVKRSLFDILNVYKN